MAKKLIYRITDTQNRGAYNNLYLEIQFAEIRDMKDQLADATRYSDDSLAHCAKLLKELRNATGGTKYFHGSGSDNEVTMKWQGDRDNPGRWYACSVEMRHTEECAELYSRVCKILNKYDNAEREKPYDSRREYGCFGFGADAKAIVTALNEAGAVRVKRLDGSCYDSMPDNSELPRLVEIKETEETAVA
jgi:hypothetical protein